MQTYTYKAGTNMKNGGMDKDGKTIRYDDFEPYYTPQQIKRWKSFKRHYEQVKKTHVVI